MKFIYKITNQINSKVYIGQTYKPSRRKSQHFMEGSREISDHPLYRSMRKHGIENFTFEVIEECPTDQFVDEREIHWIAYFDSTNQERGYNLDRGGKGTKKEDRKTISESLKGNKHCVGRTLSEETKKKLSESASKQKCSIGTRSKLRAAVRRRKKEGQTTLMSGSLPGESHPCAKLDWEKVRLIRKRYKDGETVLQLVEAFQLSRPTISRVVRNVVWRE